MYSSITDEYGHDPHADRGNPDNYFAALLAAVQLTFRNTKKFKVQISLVKSTLLDDDVAREVFATAPGYYETVNGTHAITKAKQEATKNSPKYKDGDAVFFVTTKDVLTSYEPGNWNGAPQTGGMCIFPINIGLVTDDGKTFTGVESMAQQIAVLIGASLESNCSNTTEYAPPSVFAKGEFVLSSCNEDAIKVFLSNKNSSQDCVTTPPVVISKSEVVLPAVYNNKTGYDICTAGTTPSWREVRPCKVGDRHEKWERPCGVQCCEYHSRFTRYRRGIRLSVARMADGAVCGENQICIFGKCENVTEGATATGAGITL